MKLPMATGGAAADRFDETDLTDLVEETPPHLRRKTVFAIDGVFGVLLSRPTEELDGPTLP